jgi:hypothetical protein
MTRINFQINLSSLKSVTQWMKGKTGPVECLIIPIDANYLYRGKNGLILDGTGFEIRSPKEGQKNTHIGKQSLPKEVYETLTDEEKRAIPVLGNLTLMEVQSNTMPDPLKEDDTLPY